MTALTELETSPFARVLYVGDSGAGKTGSLVSLVPDYSLRIITFDNKLDILRHQIAQQFPDRMSSVDFVSVRDEKKITRGGIVTPSTKAFVATHKLLDEWPDGTRPAEWGDSHILVIDPMTYLGLAAYDWAQAMNPASGSGGQMDKRAWYQDAQKGLQALLMTLTSNAFGTNVIVISHVDYSSDDLKAFPTTIGKALGPNVSSLFQTYVAAEVKTVGKTTTRKIQTIPTNQLKLFTSAPLTIEAEYDLNTGMGKIFRKLKESRK